MNLLQCSPLCDSHGRTRYFIGAQIDVSGLAMEGAQMDSLQELKERKDNPDTIREGEEKNEFQELGELFSPRELQNVHANGGQLFNPVVDEFNQADQSRLYLPGSPEKESELRMEAFGSTKRAGGLAGVYKNVSFPTSYPAQASSDIQKVPPGPTLPIPPHSLHITGAPNPGYPPVIIHVSHRRHEREARNDPARHDLGP